MKTFLLFIVLLQVYVSCNFCGSSVSQQVKRVGGSVSAQPALGYSGNELFQVNM